MSRTRRRREPALPLFRTLNAPAVSDRTAPAGHTPAAGPASPLRHSPAGLSFSPLRHPVRRQPFSRLPHSLTALLVCSALAACGGGGGSSSPAPGQNSGNGSQSGTATQPGNTTNPGNTANPDSPTQPGQNPAPVVPAPHAPTTPANSPLSGNDADNLSQRPTPAVLRVSGTIQGPAAASVALPVAQQRAQSSTLVTYDRQANPRIWVVNPDQNTVAVLDSSTQTLLKEIPVGDGPRTVAIDNAGYAWVSNRYSGTISIIAPDTLTVVTTLELGAAVQPYGVVAAADGSGVWASTLGSQELLQFDATTRALKKRQTLGPDVRHLAISANSTTLLASRFISPPVPGENTLTVNPDSPDFRGGEVLQFDPATATLKHTIRLGMSREADGATSARGLPNYLGAPVISPSGRQAWVPSKQDNIQRGTARDGKALDYESTVRAILSNIDLDGTTPAEAATRRYDLDNSSVASAAAYTPNGQYVLVALETSRELAIIDAGTAVQVRRMDSVGMAPQGVAVSPDGTQAVVANVMQRTLTFLDIRSLMTERDPGSVTVTGRLVKTISGADRLPAQVLRGKQLFHDARDTRLARDNYMSCASCHSEGYGDGRVWDMTGLGEGLRKTISLVGHGGKKERLHWSGNFDEVQDFEAQIIKLEGGAGLMPAGSLYQNNRNDPLGGKKQGLSTDLDALAAYVNSLGQYAPSPYRNSDRSMTAAGKAGEALFAAKGCTTCHGNADLGNGGTKLDDIGTLKPASGTVQGKPLTGITTPGLRDAWYTFPYLHDGSAATLEAAIRVHNTNVLTEQEVSSLAAYIRQAGNGQ
jgi:carbohydrate binding module (family 6)